MTTFSIQSFGCRVNQAEAFEWAEALQELGLKLEKEYLRSELVIVNTCALTSGAERDARKFLRRLARLNPQARLVVTGCAVPLLKAEIEKNPQVEVVISNEEKSRFLSRLLERKLVGPANELKEKYNRQEEFPKERTKEDLIFKKESIAGEFIIERRNIKERRYCEAEKGLFQGKKIIEEEFESQVRPFRSRALIKVQDGCSHACTFCLIPQVRGPGRSLPASEIIHRMEHLIELGYREIVLAGIHLTSYGQEDGGETSLFELLKLATCLQNLGRIRLSSLDPRAMDETLIDFIAGHEKVCQHFHLSLQHVSPRLLRLMGRKGGPEDYQRILNRLRQKSPFASIGADIIVGFPGETEEDFLFLENFILNSALTYLHVFPYSPRPGTPAARWPQLEARIKKERAERLRSLGRRKNYEFRQSLLGLVFEGIVVGEKEPSESEVLTHNYLKVRVKGRLKEGEAVVVKIEEVKPELTRGSIISSWAK